MREREHPEDSYLRYLAMTGDELRAEVRRLKVQHV
jgi:hypothetical protein